MEIRFDRSICSDLQQALRREWLETNGLGGFAGSSIVGLNTRRYHGLLVAATKPPVGRFLLPSKLEETLLVDGNRFELSANQYPGVVHPNGQQYLREFRLDPFPVFAYEAGGVELIKSLFMIQGENSTVIRYRVNAPAGSRRSIRLELRPLIAFRDYHSTTRQNWSSPMLTCPRCAWHTTAKCCPAATGTTISNTRSSASADSILSRTYTTRWCWPSTPGPVTRS